jgi:SAM-dependent methyltransferase
MRPDEYTAMYAVEDQHWWYVGMRRVAEALLRQRFNGRRGALAVLDAGCGTGGNSAHLRAYGRVTGIDFSSDALQLAAERPGLRLARASVEALPFADESFDLVLSKDVLCHHGVARDVAAVREFARVLRPGGVLFLQLPAYEWLRSHHDEAVHTGHRYTAAELRGLLRAGGLRARRVTHANGLLLPAAAAWRALNRLRPDHGPDHSDVRPVAGPVNAVMRAALSLEAPLIARRDLPFGLSVIGVAEKVARPYPLSSLRAPGAETESASSETNAAHDRLATGTRVGHPHAQRSGGVPFSAGGRRTGLGAKPTGAGGGVAP